MRQVTFASSFPIAHALRSSGAKSGKPQGCSRERTADGIWLQRGALRAAENEPHGVASARPKMRPLAMSLSRLSSTPLPNMSTPLTMSTSSAVTPVSETARAAPPLPANRSRKNCPGAAQAAGVAAGRLGG